MARPATRFPRPLAGLFIVGVVGFVMLAAALIRSAARAIPVPPTAAGLVGEWRGDGVALCVSPGGTVREEHAEPGDRWWVQGQLTAVAGDTLIVDVLVRRRRLVVQEWPHTASAAWTTVVDGRRLTRRATACDAA